MNKKRKNTIKENKISEIREVNLGGYSQKIMIDGKNKENPIVICLHGGPGSPIPFSVGCRGMFPEITERITLVCWDQLGCGINNRPIDDSFKISDFVRMTEDLAMEIRRLFPQNKLYLFGVSWGSVLAALTAANKRVSLDGVVTYGQVLFDMTFNDEVYTALENSKMPECEKKKLNGIKNERTVQNAVKIMGYIRKYTEGYTCKSCKKTPLTDMVLGLLQSPDYRFGDFKAVFVNGYAKNSSLIKELLDIDLRDSIANVNVPYKIIQGDTDIVTSTGKIEEFLAGCGNGNLKFVKVENSGHMPGAEGMERIVEEIMEFNKK